MALSDLSVRQAKATGTAYTLGDIDGLSLNVSPTAANPGISATTGPGNKSAFHWASTRKSLSGRRARHATKRAPGWPKALLRASLSLSAMRRHFAPGAGRLATPGPTSGRGVPRK
jgi:hypothetical protein